MAGRVSDIEPGLEGAAVLLGTPLLGAALGVIVSVTPIAGLGVAVKTGDATPVKLTVSVGLIDAVSVAVPVGVDELVRVKLLV